MQTALKSIAIFEKVAVGKKNRKEKLKKIAKNSKIAIHYIFEKQKIIYKKRAVQTGIIA